MKTRSTIIILLFSLLSVFAYGQETGDTIISKNQSKLKVRVLYFHITNRCNTCYSIEKNLRTTMFGNFKSQIDSGLVDLYIINCELPDYQILVKKYEAYGATLAITTYNNGTELKSEDYSNWAFQKVHNPDVFSSELKDKIVELLK